MRPLHHLSNTAVPINILETDQFGRNDAGNARLLLDDTGKHSVHSSVAPAHVRARACVYIL